MACYKSFRANTGGYLQNKYTTNINMLLTELRKTIHMLIQNGLKGNIFIIYFSIHTAE